MKSTICFNVDSKTRIPSSIFSKAIGRKDRIVDNSIDWDISAVLLDSQNQLISQDGFIFFNNPNYKDDIITIKSSFEINCHSEFDEEIIIDLDRIPINVSSVMFFLSNHQKFNFDIASIEVIIKSSPFQTEDSNQFTIARDNVGNALELFKFSRELDRSLWKIEILNLSISDPNGMSFILNKYSGQQS